MKRILRHRMNNYGITIEFSDGTSWEYRSRKVVGIILSAANLIGREWTSNPVYDHGTASLRNELVEIFK